MGLKICANLKAKGAAIAIRYNQGFSGNIVYVKEGCLRRATPTRQKTRCQRIT